ncbi:VOC family metalloprotein YjdN [Intestinirhabdus alba]|jgi:PhnB protein|uniref:VOC family metalloprotein YjdN n=1 Tax=Intestinirhabdus alba TaxID=2899544 RepID=A0A6L6IPG1_9ENTR|nr:VOC family metalloprotein YjdN [Intestinirhabdus alba]MTH48731.1 VOC family metalloprotein YjdN [Intestinirhabdus alba]
MPLNPYLSFAGNCADAIAYYQQNLDAALLYKISFGEVQGSGEEASAAPFPDDAVAHASLRIAGSEIMMSDALPSGSARYSGFTLILDAQDASEGKRWFDNLAAQGTIEMAWQESFWAYGYGKVIDRYGVPWLVSATRPTEGSR